MFNTHIPKLSKIDYTNVKIIKNQDNSDVSDIPSKVAGSVKNSTLNILI